MESSGPSKESAHFEKEESIKNGLSDVKEDDNEQIPTYSEHSQ